MKKENEDYLRPEYDFSKGIRGKHAKKYAQGSNVVLLEPDVAELFPTAAAVNKALREHAEEKRRALVK